LVLAKVFPVEALAIHFVNLVELLVLFGLKRGESAHRLRSKRPAVNEKQDAFGDTGLHQPVTLIHHREGLAGSGRHGNEHLPLTAGDRFLYSGVGLALVRSKSFVVVWPREEIGGGSSAIAREKLAQGFRGVESCDLIRAVQSVADVVEPDDLAIG